MARLPTVTARVGLTIARLRFVGFSFPLGSAFVAFAFARAGVVAVRREATVTGPFPFSTTFTFVTVVSPPFVVGGGGIVRDCGFGRGLDQLLKLKFRIALEAFVGEQFHHFVEGKGAFNVAFGTGGLDRVIGSLSDAVQEPVDTLFFGRGVKGVVVGHLGN